VRTPSKPVGTLVAVLATVLALALVSGCGSSAGSGPIISDVSANDHGFRGAYLPEPYTVPDVTLTDDEGKPFTLATDDRDVDVVFFGYVNCPDVCQVVMGALTSAYLRLPASQRDRVRVVFVTTDPARDTPKALHEYLARFDPHFVGLTGSIDQIDRLGRPLHVFIKKGQKLPSGGYEVDHSAAVYAVTRGRVPLVWTNGTAPTDVAKDVARLLEGKS
jgi:protein SCO1/2